MSILAIIAIELLILFALSKKLHIGFGRLFYRITKNPKGTTYLLAVLFLPGTFVHEMSHFLSALFLLVPVGQFELMPEIQDEKRIKLGSVPIGKTDFIRRFLIGSAPFVVGNILIFLIIYFLTIKSVLWWHIVLAVYLVFEIGNTMYLSKKDMEGAWKMLLVFMFLIAVFYIIGLRFQMNIFQTLFSENTLMVLRNVAKFLFIPIIIDGIIISFFKLVRIS